MNPGLLFLPIYRASTTAFLLGLLLLAVIDFARISSGVPYLSGWVGMLALWFFVFSVHANRLRHCERGSGLAFLPLGIAVIAKFIGWISGVFTFTMGAMVEFAAERGIDVDPDGALEDALTNPDFMRALEDPDFVQSFTIWAEEDETVQAAAATVGSSPSYIGFWVVIALFAIWFSQMKRLGGSLQNVPDDTPSMLNPTPMDPPAQEAPEPSAAPETPPAEQADEAVDAADEALAPEEAADADVSPAPDETDTDKSKD